MYVKKLALAVILLVMILGMFAGVSLASDGNVGRTGEDCRYRCLSSKLSPKFQKYT